jgi:hypothetical protein
MLTQASYDTVVAERDARPKQTAYDAMVDERDAKTKILQLARDENYFFLRHLMHTHHQETSQAKPRPVLAQVF